MSCPNPRCPCRNGCSCGPFCRCGARVIASKASTGCGGACKGASTGGASCGCGGASCGASCGCARKTATGAPKTYKQILKARSNSFKPGVQVRGTDLERMVPGVPQPEPFRTNRYNPSQDPYSEHLRYALAKGLLSSMMLAQIGLDPMGYQPVRPAFVQTGQGTMIAGTNTSFPPRSSEPYDCRSQVIASLAFGLKYGLLNYVDVARIGLNPLAIRSCLP